MKQWLERLILYSTEHQQIHRQDNPHFVDTDTDAYDSHKKANISEI